MCGVAVLSCTDCSGSSTASSDITEPGSPFSVASSHSEDSGLQPAKMPPTQSAHLPPWSWTEENTPLKRPSQEKTAFTKRLKTDEDSKQSPTCLNNNINTSQVSNLSVLNKTVTAQVLPKATSTADEPSPNLITNRIKLNKVTKKPDTSIAPKMQQGKITEYFKSQLKLNGIKKELSNLPAKINSLQKCVKLVDGAKQLINKSSCVRKIDVRTVIPVVKKMTSMSTKNRKPTPAAVPRKILPAPNVNGKIAINSINNFHPVTLTAVAFPPNLTYLHTKTPKPPDNIFVPQFAINSDKINAIPIVNRTQCLNVIQPIQKITTINNFNCVKLNATVVPIVKLNTLPSRLNGSNLNTVALNVETGSPTVLSAKPTTGNNLTPKQQSSSSPLLSSSSTTKSETVHNTYRSEISSTPDSDSGISSKDSLEISVSHTITTESQKSPILSQPKTIRFPAKQENPVPKEKRSHSNDTAACQWAECHAQFDTNGALLEHLQVKHVISQATQEQYVCLWLGCKVHGRTSCSRTWLERHVLAHAGTKPFRCIVDGCGMRFNSQLALERHVNNHFNSDASQNGNNKKSLDNGSAKLFKRNGKKIRFRRQPWSARMFDFIDSGIMEGLQHKLLTMTEKRTMGQFENVSGDSITLQSQVLARRIEADGKRQLLLRWHPQNVIPDEWIAEKDYSPTRNLPIPKTGAAAKTEIKSLLFPLEQSQLSRQKHRRKQCKQTT